MISRIIFGANMNFKDWPRSTQFIINEAKKRGIKITEVISKKMIKLTKGDNVQYLFSQFSSKTSSIALFITLNKNFTREILANNNISIANGSDFEPHEKDRALQLFRKLRKPVVTKPSSDTHGRGVITGIDTEEEFIVAWEKYKTLKSKRIIIEEQFEGREFRIFANPSQVIAVSERVPAHVVGDGKNTIQQLINIKNNDPRRGSPKDISKSMYKIKIDEILVDYIAKQGYKLDDVLDNNKRLDLRNNSNMASGGENRECLDEVHNTVKEIAINTVKSIPGLAWAGVDFMTKDISKKHGPNDYIIVEVNASPGLSMHHNPIDGKSINVAGKIVDMLFPETKSEIKKEKK